MTYTLSTCLKDTGGAPNGGLKEDTTGRRWREYISL